ncbi:GLPGLI family protein [Chryseobacterium sp. JK1]|uniref:GLPGLI family protein n=1 Tax=Chryseobacterium sp. JK1 TaxID=874294 RepID=UPI003D69F356
MLLVKKTFHCILVILACLPCLKAQDIRIVYEYKVQKDSLKEDIQTSDMYLDISAMNSYFYNPSLTNRFIENKSKAEQNKIADMHIIIKNRKNNEIIDITDLDGDTYKVFDDRKIIWTLTKERDTILGYESQKAITSFGGRQWNAWFTMAIPSQEGPYKFHGLPGTIIKMEDDKKQHSFTIQSLQTLNDFEIEGIEDKFNSIKITQAQYKKIYTNYRKNPVRKWREKGIVKGLSDHGKEENASEVLKNMEKYLKMNLPNNVLEADLLK